MCYYHITHHQQNKQYVSMWPRRSKWFWVEKPFRGLLRVALRNLRWLHCCFPGNVARDLHPCWPQEFLASVTKYSSLLRFVSEQPLREPRLHMSFPFPAIFTSVCIDKITWRFPLTQSRVPGYYLRVWLVGLKYLHVKYLSVCKVTTDAKMEDEHTNWITVLRGINKVTALLINCKPVP